MRVFMMFDSLDLSKDDQNSQKSKNNNHIPYIIYNTLYQKNKIQTAAYSGACFLIDIF